jgi:hypothetical protein
MPIPHCYNRWGLTIYFSELVGASGKFFPPGLAFLIVGTVGSTFCKMAIGWVFQ